MTSVRIVYADDGATGFFGKLVKSNKLSGLLFAHSTAVDFYILNKGVAGATANATVTGNNKVNEQWYLKYCGIQSFWERPDAVTGEGTVVAVIDTGVDYDHEDLSQNIWVNSGEIPDDGVDNDGKIVKLDVLKLLLLKDHHIKRPLIMDVQDGSYEREFDAFYPCVDKIALGCNRQISQLPCSR